VHLPEGISLSLRAAEDASITCDENKLRQVLVNLLDNGIKYSPEGGPVDVDVINRGGIAIVSAMLTGEYLDDLRRAFRENHVTSLKDVRRAYREGHWTTIEDPGRSS